MIPFIIANWKMHLSLNYATQICNKLTENGLMRNLIIAPPLPYLSYLAKNFPNINFAAQNVSEFENEGAYTGEYSSMMLKSCDVNYAIIGHSERRTIFNESNQIVSKKARLLQNSQITPIICIGESLEIRQNGQYKDYLITQLEESLKSVANEVIIAYEPIWSIGTDVLPSLEQLNETFSIINFWLKQSNLAINIHVVYGGSVNLDNIKQITSLNHVSGVLVGKASLMPDVLIKMFKRLQK